MKNYELCDFEQGTKEWYEARASRITGTRLNSVMSSKKATRDELIATLIYEAIAPLQDVYQSDTMARWHLVEAVVKEIYGNGKITNVGFIKRLDEKHLGISPDGVEISEDGNIYHAVEIKAPLGKNFIKYWLDDKIPAEYFWQTVHYFVVIEELQTLDFIIHNPEPYDSTARTKIIRVTRTELESQIFAATAAIAEFTVEWSAAVEKFVANVEKSTKK